MKPLILLLLLIPMRLPAQSEPDSLERAKKPDPGFTPWTVISISAQSLQTLPMRSLDGYLSLVPGAANVSGSFLFRGSSFNAYYLDNIPVTNPFLNSSGAPIIPQALESLELHSGPYGTEFAGTTGGLIISRMKRGGEVLAFSVDARTDAIAAPGGNLTVSGYKDIVATVGGPLPMGIKFFLAGEYGFMRNRQPIFLEPFRFDNLVTDGLNGRPSGEPLPGVLEVKRNHVPGNEKFSFVLQGNASWSMGPLEVEARGSYQNDEQSEGGSWPAALQNIFRQKRFMRLKQQTGMAGFNGRYVLTGTTHLHASVSFHGNSLKMHDPDFGDDWRSYVDSVANERRGYTGFRFRYTGPAPYSVIYNFPLLAPAEPNNMYGKEVQTGLRFGGGVTSSVLSFLTVSADMEAENWTFRNFVIQDIQGFRYFFDTNGDGIDDRTFASETEERERSAAAGMITNYGYTYCGEETDNGSDGPRKFSNTALAATGLLHLGDFEARLGARYEMHSVSGAFSSERKSSDEYFLPRVSAAYTIPSFRGWLAWGEYLQYSPLDGDFLGSAMFASLPPSLDIQPNRTSHLEAGVVLWPTDLVSFEIAGFLKTRIQVPVGLIRFSGPLVSRIAGTAEVSSKGIELLARTTRIMGFLSEVGSSFSTTKEKYTGTTDFVPAEIDQSPRIRALVDYSTGGEHGQEMFGVTLFARLFGGHAYTPLTQPVPSGTLTPWNVGVQGYIDPRSRVLTGSIGSARTPWTSSIDLQLRTGFRLGEMTLSVYAVVINLLNKKNITNVYPQTGSAEDDGWLGSPYSTSYRSIQNYEAFYRAINLDNRWAYGTYAGGDIYGSPRQFWLGVKVGG